MQNVYGIESGNYDFFEKYKLSELSHSELGRQLWNCNETGICTAVASKKLHGRGYLPPYIVCKGEDLLIPGIPCNGWRLP